MTVESLPIRQLPSGSVVEDGRPLAALGVRPEQISERAPIEWFDGHDDLDEYRAAVVSVDPDEARFALLAYPGSRGRRPDRRPQPIERVARALAGG